MKIFMSVLIAGSLLFFSGCIEVKTVVNINPDGTGTVEETLLLSKEVIEIFTQFAAAFDDSANQQEEVSLFTEEEFRKRESGFGPFVKFTSGEKITKGDREGYHAVYSFSNINDLRIDQNPNSKLPLDSGSEEFEEEVEEITFNFIKGDPSVLTINMPQADLVHDDDTTESDMDETAFEDTSNMAHLIEMLSDFSISLIFNINGEIEETNATYLEDGAITLFDINFGELMKNEEKFNEFKEMKPDNMQQLKEIIKDVKGIKAEFNNPLVIKFK